MNNQVKLAKLKKIFGYLLFVLSFVMLYIILIGGQFSFNNRSQSTNNRIWTVNRNDKQSDINTEFSETNELLIHDEKTQKKTSAEIGYMEPNENRVKKIFKSVRE